MTTAAPTPPQDNLASMKNEFGMDLSTEGALVDPLDAEVLKETEGASEASEKALLALAEDPPDDDDDEDDGEKQAKADEADAKKAKDADLDDKGEPAEGKQPPAAPKPGESLTPEQQAAADILAATPAAPAAPISMLGTDFDKLDLPVFKPTAPADAAAKIEAAKAAIREAEQKKDDGEIEPAEFYDLREKQEAIIEPLKDALTEDRMGAKMIGEQHTKAYHQVLGKAVDILKTAGVDLGDGKTDESKANISEFDTYISSIANNLVAQGMGDGNNLKMSRLAVERATAAMLVSRGIALPAAGKAAPAAATPPAKPASRAGSLPDLTKVPPTLAHAPAAATAGAGDGSLDGDFSAIDNMDEEAAEAAVAAMSPAKLKAYLAR